jgi:hypothetical protein
VHLDAIGGGGQRLLAYMPYPWGYAGHELPTLVRGSDADTIWSVFQPDPLQPFLAGTILSDPDIVELGDGAIRYYWRAVRNSHNVLVAADVRWDEPVVPMALDSAPNHSLVSPAAARGADELWRLWSVDAGPVGCGQPPQPVTLRTSTDGLTWSAPRPTNMVGWHLDVAQATDGRWLALMTATCGGSPYQWLWSSADGESWAAWPGIVFDARDAGWTIAYRSSLVFAPGDSVALYYSGATWERNPATGRDGYSWHAAREKITTAELFARAARPAPTALRAPPALPPPERP